MKLHLLYIGFGGLLGSITRFLTVHYFTRFFPTSFPIGTFAVNIVGCLLVGIVIGLSLRFSWLTPEWRFFLVTGFCGGFTTFSAFAYENIKLLQEGNYGTFAIYSSGSFLIGLAAVFTGLSLAKL